MQLCGSLVVGLTIVGLCAPGLQFDYERYSSLAFLLLARPLSFAQLAVEFRLPIIDLSRTFDPTDKKHYGTTPIEPSNVSGQFIADLIAKVRIVKFLASFCVCNLSPTSLRATKATARGHLNYKGMQAVQSTLHRSIVLSAQTPECRR